MADIKQTKEQRKKLTPKQIAFAKEYARNGGNGTESARVAGYKANTDETFRAIASENLTKPHVMELIEQERKQVEAKIVKRIPSVEEVLLMFTEIAENTKNKTSDRLKALDCLAKYHGLYKTKIVQQVDYASIIAESRNRIEQMH